MEENYIDIVDDVIMASYKDGYCIPKKEIWDIYAVRYRLNTYGEVGSEGRYFLNERGMEYAISGCSKGIKERIEIQILNERLDIETKTYTKNKQKWMFRFAIASFVLSVLSILGQLGLLSLIWRWISEIEQWICCIIS